MPFVVVLPTGGGKSLLFIVPACMDPTGVTVVVLSYRTLIEDLLGRIRKCVIDCRGWKRGESNTTAVVVVSADVACDISCNGNFLGYANMLSSKGLLRRVVINESHLVFTSSDWRPKLAILQNLRLLPCPIVLLTAMLPPVREAELASSMVSWCERGKAQETALAICRRLQQVPLLRKEQEREKKF